MVADYELDPIGIYGAPVENSTYVVFFSFLQDYADLCRKIKSN